ncbi:MAG: bifunctional glycosyltransferase family 2/GtrA family protein [bacterium]
MSKLSIIIPCFNEVRTIDVLIARVEAAPLPKGWQKELVIVDDYSTDGTRGKLTAYEGKHTVVYREKNGGKGAGLKSGMLKVSGDYVIIQDADFEYDPNEYQLILGELEKSGRKNAVVFGSRLIGQNKFFNAVYFYGNRTMTAAFNFLFGSHITDITTCYKLFPREAVPFLMRWSEDGFVYDAVYLTYELFRFDNHIIEVPITYTARTRKEGKKVNWKHGVKAFYAMAHVKVVESMIGRPIADLFAKYAQIVRFFISGGAGVFTNLFLLYVLTELVHIHYLVSATVSFLAAVCVNFLMQKFWAFKDDHADAEKDDREQKATYIQAIHFFVVQLVNLIANTGLLYVAVTHLGLQYLWSEAIISALLASVTYFVSKKYIFSSQKN